jgi:hypothetical protein
MPGISPSPEPKIQFVLPERWVDSRRSEEVYGTSQTGPMGLWREFSRSACTNVEKIILSRAPFARAPVVVDELLRVLYGTNREERSMAEDYVSDLQTLRDVHVSERRRLVMKAIESAETNDSPGGGATLGQDVVEQQRLIEAIDRAIARMRAISLTNRHRPQRAGSRAPRRQPMPPSAPKMAWSILFKRLDGLPFFLAFDIRPFPLFCQS